MEPGRWLQIQGQQGKQEEPGRDEGGKTIPVKKQVRLCDQTRVYTLGQTCLS